MRTSSPLVLSTWLHSQRSAFFKTKGYLILNCRLLFRTWEIFFSFHSAMETWQPKGYFPSWTGSLFRFVAFLEIQLTQKLYQLQMYLIPIRLIVLIPWPTILFWDILLSKLKIWVIGIYQSSGGAPHSVSFPWGILLSKSILKVN